MPEQALIIHFQYRRRNLGLLLALGKQLDVVLTTAGIGEYDGHEVQVGGGDATYYMYGPDADELFRVTRPVLEASGLMENATAIKQYGPPEEDDVKETQVLFGNAMRNYN